jgi:lysophospholipase I
MNGWFDVTSLTDVMVRPDEDRMLKSVHLVHKLITEEVDGGISSDKIIVGGFSQGISNRQFLLFSIGCAVAILAGYSCERKLAGVIGLSGWLPLHEKFGAVSMFLPHLLILDAN